MNFFPFNRLAAFASSRNKLLRQGLPLLLVMVILFITTIYAKAADGYLDAGFKRDYEQANPHVFAVDVNQHSVAFSASGKRKSLQNIDRLTMGTVYQVAFHPDSQNQTSPLAIQTPTWTSSSGQKAAFLGVSVSSAGDINGDGFKDIAIGVPYYQIEQNEVGAVFIYYGALNGLPVDPNLVITTNEVSSRFGWSVDSAGDVNQDGFSDVLVGAIGCSHPQKNEGCAYLYLGSDEGLSTSPAWSVEANFSYANLGYQVGMAGDVNGDTYSDFFVTAPGYSQGEPNEGKVFVYHGSSDVPGTLPNWQMEGNNQNAAFGLSASTAGDVNGDHIDDFVVGAPNYSGSLHGSGQVSVYLGQATTGLRSLAYWTKEGSISEMHFGELVQPVGDLNGDGYGEIAISAVDDNRNETDEGAVYVFFGSSNSMNQQAGWIGESNQEDAHYGISLRGAGDVNGDGIKDLLVGATGFDSAETNTGKVYLYYGDNQGFGSNPVWETEGNQTHSNFGYDLDFIGDVNGDGAEDFIIAAPQIDNAKVDEGMVSIYSGPASTHTPTASPTVTPTATNTPTNTLTPTATETSTPVPPTPTYTFTPVTPTLTNTAIPPTLTFTSIPPTLTYTAVPPTAIPPTPTPTPAIGWLVHVWNDPNRISGASLEEGSVTIEDAYPGSPITPEDSSNTDSSVIPDESNPTFEDAYPLSTPLPIDPSSPVDQIPDSTASPEESIANFEDAYPISTTSPEDSGSTWDQITGLLTNLIDPPQEDVLEDGSTVISPESYTLSSGPAGGWATGVTCQNMDMVNTDVTLRFYPQNGAYSTTYSAIIPTESSMNWLTTSGINMPGFPNPFLGSGTYSSSRSALNCTLNTEAKTAGTSTSPYRRATSGAFNASQISPILYLPQVLRSVSVANGGIWNSQITVQNTSASSVTVNISYYNSSGTVISAANQSATILGNGGYTFYLSDNGGLGTGFNGSAKITATGPLAATVLSYQTLSYQTGTDATHSHLMNYNGSKSGTSTVYVPRFLRKMQGYNTGLAIQNTGSAATTVAVTFYFTGLSPITKTATINPNASWLPYASSIAELLPVDSLPETQRQGNAVVTASNGGSIVVTVNEDNPTIGHASTYNAVNASETTPTVFFTQFVKNAGNFSSGLQVTNTTNTPTTCTIYYKGQSNINEAGISLPAHGSITRWALSSTIPAMVNMSSGYNAGIKVTCGQPITGVVNMSGYNGTVGDSFSQTAGANH